MQTFEIPERDHDLHIIVKRPEELPPSITEQFVTREMFQEFTDLMTSTMKKMMSKMNTIEDLLQTIASQEVVMHTTSYHHPTEQATEDDEIMPVIEIRNDMHDVDPFGNKGKIEVIEEEVEVDEAPEIFVHDVTENRIKQQRKAPVNPVPPKKIKIEKIVPRTQYLKMQYCDVESSREETVETIDEYGEVGQEMEIEIDLTFNGIPLPVQSLTGLANLNSVLEHDSYHQEKFKQRMAELTVKSEGNFQRALSMLIADNVLFELNWQGFKGKQKMSNMYIFSSLLYDEWFTHIDYDEYINQLKIITKKAHKRYAKTQERRRNRESGRLSSKAERDPVQEAIQTIVAKPKAETNDGYSGN